MTQAECILPGGIDATPMDREPNRPPQCRYEDAIMSDPLISRDGAPTAPVSSNELEQALDQLADREARLKAILDTAVDAIVVIDEHGNIESTNAVISDIFGYEPDELVGTNVNVLMPEPHHSNHDAYIARYLETGEAHIIGIGREAEGRHKSGRRIPIDLSVAEFTVSGRRRFTGVIRDISDRRRAEDEARRRRDELAHAARLSTLGELSSGIAHEINQPLTAIVSFAEACLRMLRSSSPDPARLESALEQIAAQGERAGEITRHLRRLARKGEREHESIDINRAVRGLLELVRNELDMNEITLHLELDESLPTIRCNRIQIEQVVLNLVRNAMDAMECLGAREHALTVRTRAGTNREILLEVEDTGDGFSESNAEQLFEPFFTTKPEGLGLGLSISRTIVQDHGGRLWASHGAAGAVLHVSLPVHGKSAS